MSGSERESLISRLGSVLIGVVLAVIITPVLLLGALYVFSDSFRNLVDGMVESDRNIRFHDRAYDELCEDGSLLLVDAADFSWDEVYLAADESWLVSRFGEKARIPSASDNWQPGYVFVKDGKVVRVIPVSGVLSVEPSNRAWPRSVRIEFGPPTPESGVTLPVNAVVGPAVPVDPALVERGCASLASYR